MTVLEWLTAKTRYSFDEETFKVIIVDREVNPSTDVMTITKRQKELMEADVIFTAVLLSPSNTASVHEAHNGYSKTIGQEQDFYQDKKITYAIQIYKKYDDEKAEALEASQKRIKCIPIVDVL